MTKKNIQKVDWRVVSVGLVCIAGLEAYALSQGFNGWLLTTVIGVIAGTIGYTIPSPFKKE